ncbi:hypothetical protein ACFLUS_03915 [Chloroflexota bacterium]
MPTPTPTPTPSSVSPPTLKALTPGMGSAVGQVLFIDGMGAYQYRVYIFKTDSEYGYASCQVDANGYYVFPRLPPAKYTIYCVIPPVWDFTGYNLDAHMNVVEGETTTAPTIRDKFRIIEIGCKGEYAKGSRPNFSWVDVPTAAYYRVQVWSKHPWQEYQEEVRISNTDLVWPMLLLDRQYRVVVEVYNAVDKKLGFGYKDFWIGPPSN